MRVLGQQIVSGEQIIEVLFPRHAFLLRAGLRMAAQIERQADATKPGDTARAVQVALLAATPTVYEQHAWHLLRR